MNQKELNEIRRRWKIDRCSISAIYGCYVNSAKEIVSQFDTSLGLLSHDEAEMYLAIMKKALSGTLGKNLIDIEFATAQVAGSEEHSILMRLKKELLHDDEAREALYRRIIDALALEDESGYLILLAADAYDVPYHGRGVQILRVLHMPGALRRAGAGLQHAERRIPPQHGGADRRQPRAWLHVPVL